MQNFWRCKMLEEQYRNKLQNRLEKIGGFVFRINDVAGTGIRYADLIWVYNGNVYFIECKIAKCKLSHVSSIIQKHYATPAQTLANHIVQKAGALYLFAFYFPKEKEERLLYYKTEDIYNYAEESNKKPSVVMWYDTLVDFVVSMANKNDSSPVLKKFQEIFCEDA